MRLGDHGAAKGQRWTPEDVIPTGSFRLDHALGVGGLPRGRVTEIVRHACAVPELAFH